MVKLSEKEEIARKKVCLPLDGLHTIDEVKSRLQELSPYVGLFKVGKELFTKFGPQILKLVKSYGSEVFLDLKYHDIPNTVKGAARVATELGVEMFDVHASGGSDMMKAAKEGVREADTNKKPKILAVTILTSIDKDIMNNELNIKGDVEDQILKLAKLAEESSLDGIICSPADVHAIKDKLPKDIIYVTPGIKGPNTAAGSDQRRVLTPGRAIQEGSTILVIGRAITAVENRVQAAIDVLQDIAKVI